jgi:hypothetical protein
MIIWKGFGILAIIIPVFISWIISLLVDIVLGEGYSHSHIYIISVSILISAVVVWYVGKKLNTQPGEILINPEDGETVEIKKCHTFFWIPLQWTAFIIGAMGIWMIVLGIVKS